MSDEMRVHPGMKSILAPIQDDFSEFRVEHQGGEAASIDKHSWRIIFRIPPYTPQPDTAGSSLKEGSQRLFDEPSPTTLAITTGGYHIALNNRLTYDQLTDGALDIRRWPPTFVFDILMLPGTLAQCLNKESETDLIDRMTPAGLRGYRALVHPVTKQPCLVVSDEPADVVYGMIICGQGKNSRSRIHRHYQQHNAKVQRTDVEIEVAVPIPSRSRGGPKWTLRGWNVQASVCVWAGDHSPDFPLVDRSSWTLENYLSGAYD